MKSKSLWIMTLLLLGFWLTATRWLNKPFIGHHDWDNVLLSITVLNYETNGYLEHHGLQQRTPEWTPQQQPYLYRSTPPTFAILLSLAVRAFSFDELTLRIPNILLSLVSISVFYQFVRQLYGKTAGLWGAFFFASAPF
ncbi:MAG: glycosyltransferase family 39 protein, partial [Anaerolineae bacterium]|nr:glycosyltransferase family 39 protein [Anaerolineae bacterium]